MRTLVSFLNERPPLELRAIADYWEANLTDRLYAGNTFQLAQEMQSEFLQRRVVEKLSRREQQLLLYIAGQSENSVTMRKLVEDQQSDLKEMTRLVTGLRQVGLLYEDKIKTTPDDPDAASAPATRAGWAELYSRRMPPQTAVIYRPVLVMPRELARPFSRLLQEKNKSELLQPEKPEIPLSRQPILALLAHLEPEQVEVQAEYWGILVLKGEVGPEQMRKELAQALADKVLQKRVLDDLPADSRKLFEQLKKQGGRTTLAALRQELVSLKRLGRILRPLTERMLVWEVFEDRQEVVFIPEEILHAQARPETTDHQPLQTVTAPSDATTFPPYALAWDILTYLNYIQQNVVELTNQGYIPKRDQKKIAAQLWVNEQPDENHRMRFLIGLSYNRGLYERDFETSQLLATHELEGWLKLDFNQQMRVFCEIWLEEPARVGPVSFPYYYGNNKYISKANKTILGWLSECEAGTWYSLASLLQKVQREDPFFIMSRRDLLNLMGHQRLTEMSRMWPRIEGEIIQQTFNTALEWLGLVKVSRNEQGRVVAFSLTEFGAEMAGKAEAVQQTIPASNASLLVQPNFEIMLFVPQPETLWTLLKIATIKQLDQVSLFTLSRNSVLKGLEAGLSPAEITDWLQAHNPQPLPQNLLVSIEDWSKGFKRVKVEQVTILEVDDPAILQELLSSKQFSGSIVRQLSPTTAIVTLPDVMETKRNSPVKAFKNRLKAGGYFTN